MRTFNGFSLNLPKKFKFVHFSQNFTSKALIGKRYQDLPFLTILCRAYTYFTLSSCQLYICFIFALYLLQKKSLICKYTPKTRFLLFENQPKNIENRGV